MIFLTIGLIVGGVAVIFILQNIFPISVHLFSWEVQGSLALILILALLTGAVLAALSCLPDMFKNYFAIKSLNERIKKLESEVDDYKKNIEELSRKAGVAPMPPQPPTSTTIL